MKINMYRTLLAAALAFAAGSALASDSTPGGGYCKAGSACVAPESQGYLRATTDGGQDVVQERAFTVESVQNKAGTSACLIAGASECVRPQAAAYVAIPYPQVVTLNASFDSVVGLTTSWLTYSATSATFACARNGAPSTSYAGAVDLSGSSVVIPGSSSWAAGNYACTITATNSVGRTASQSVAFTVAGTSGPQIYNLFAKNYVDGNGIYAAYGDMYGSYGANTFGGATHTYLHWDTTNAVSANLTCHINDSALPMSTVTRGRTTYYGWSGAVPVSVPYDPSKVPNDRSSVVSMNSKDGRYSNPDVANWFQVPVLLATANSARNPDGVSSPYTCTLTVTGADGSTTQASYHFSVNLWWLFEDERLASSSTYTGPAPVVQQLPLLSIRAFMGYTYTSGPIYASFQNTWVQGQVATQVTCTRFPGYAAGMGGLAYSASGTRPGGQLVFNGPFEPTSSTIGGSFLLSSYTMSDPDDYFCRIAARDRLGNVLVENVQINSAADVSRLLQCSTSRGCRTADD